MNRAIRLIGIISIIEALVSSASATNYVWIGNNEDWSDATDWTPSGIPSTTNDSGVITSFTVYANTTLGSAGNYPAITVSGTGVVQLSGSGATPLILSNGKLKNGGGTVNSPAPITVAAGTTNEFNVGNNLNLKLSGAIEGSGCLRVTQTGWIPTWTANLLAIFTNNSGLTGNWIVENRAMLQAEHTNALGSGAVTLGGSESLMILNLGASADWTLTNDLGGTGTIKVEDGSGTYRLTAQGSTIVPGGTDVAGILDIDGNFAFAANSAGTRIALKVDIVDRLGVPGSDFDQLLVEHGDGALAAGITNCDLEITVVPTAERLNGSSLSIVSSADADFSSYCFNSTNWSGAEGELVYTNGSIRIEYHTGAPVIQNNGASNVTQTSAELYGTLISTGDAPAEVYLFWGLTDGGEDLAGWDTNAYFGVNSQPLPALFQTNLAGLASVTNYYFRFYATNSVGHYWAAPVGNFFTGFLYYTNMGTGNWSDPTKWNLNQVPTNFYDVVTITGGTLAADMNIPGIVSIDVNGGTLNLSTYQGWFGTLGGPGCITVNTGGALSISSMQWSNAPPVTLAGGTITVASASISSPLILSGGTINHGASAKTFTNSWTMVSDTTNVFDLSGNVAMTLNGPISGSGTIETVCSSGSWASNWNANCLKPSANNTNYSGNWIVGYRGELKAGHSNAFGSGTVTVSGADSRLEQDANNIGNAVILDGGVYRGMNNYTNSSPITLTTNGGTLYVYGNYIWECQGLIDGPGKLTLNSSATRGVVLAYAGNTYWGGTVILPPAAGLSRVVVKANNALGATNVVVEPRGELQLNADDISGSSGIYLMKGNTNGILILSNSATVFMANLGGIYDADGGVTGGIWLAAGQYADGSPNYRDKVLSDYISFSTNTLTVLHGGVWKGTLFRAW